MALREKPIRKNDYVVTNSGGKDTISLLNKRVLVALLCMVLVVSFSATYSKVYASTQKIVYVVISVDTESINGKYLNSSILHPSMDVSLYSSSPPSTFTRVFDPAFRGSISDSFGNSFKMTWYTEMDYLYSQSIFVNGTAPAGISGYTAMLDLLQKNWGSQMETFGDSIEYHHHFEVYRNGIWQAYDDGPDAGYGDYQMYALDHMIIDNGFYPASFRSGWNVMSTSMSNWVEQWFPFDYCPSSGGWSPVHAYPGMNHNQSQTAFGTYQGQVQQAFVEARDHGSSIYSFYMHEGDNMVGSIADLSSYLKNLASDQFSYPGVKYEFVTAAQAMQLASGYTDVSPPTFQVSRNGSIYIVSSSETLWSNNLYFAVSYVNGSYVHLAAFPVGANMWTVNVPSSSLIDKIGVAANDLYGNPGVLVPSTIPQGQIPPAPTVPQTMLPEIQIPVVGVTASSYLSSYSPDKAVDGNDSSLTNYWGTARSSGLPHWLKLDLWSVVPVNRFTTYFFDGDSRNYSYSVDVSIDGSTWTTVVAPKVAGGNVTDDFNVVLARYVRLNVLGNTANSAADVKETKVFQPTVVPQPTPTPSPTPSPSPSPTPTASPTPSPTPSPSPSPTVSPTPSPTPSPSPSPTVSPTPSPIGSSTPVPSVTVSPSPSPVHTASPSPPVAGEFANNAALYSIVGAIAIVGAVNAVIFVRKKKVKV